MKKGFTLVEAVIAMTLLAMTLALFTITFVQAKRSATIADNRMKAIHDARHVMENLLSQTYNSALLSPGAHLVSGISSISNVSYSVMIVTQAPDIIVKNIYLTNRWINPNSKNTSELSLAGSVCAELHQ